MKSAWRLLLVVPQCLPTGMPVFLTDTASTAFATQFLSLHDELAVFPDTNRCILSLIICK